MSLDQLRSIDQSSFDIVSVDVFDTLLLRDCGTQRGRFQAVARRVAAQMAGHGHRIEAASLLKLRCLAHDLAYRAVMIERPAGDATLARMIELQLLALGLDRSFAGVFQDAELAVEKGRLHPNKPLLRLLRSFRAAGKRVIAVSDMYFSRGDLDVLLNAVLNEHPVERIYVSSDIGLTKAGGQLMPRIARLEGVSLDRILHCGDHPHADVAMSRAAGCQAVLLGRPAWVHVMRRLSALLFLFRHRGSVAL